MGLDITGIGEVANLGKTILDKIWPDAGEVEKAKVQQVLAFFTAQAQIVQTEAASSNFLTSSWRPIVMLTFTGLIVARWLGYSAPNISDNEVMMLWEIVKLGLGGYVIGRSIEKTAETVVTAIKK